MPIMQVHYPQGALDGGRKGALALRLTEVLLTMEGGAKTPGGLAFASVMFTEVPRDDWWVGGRTDETHVARPGKFLVRVTIPEGYMSKTNKTNVHVSVNAAILAVTEEVNDPNGGASVQVVLDEVPEGNWGAKGRTISLATIADAVGLPKTGERFKWVRRYFAAKAKQYAAFGYPADASGLLPNESSIGDSP